jgi:hypothetical protein
MSGTEPSH